MKTDFQELTMASGTFEPGLMPDSEGPRELGLDLRPGDVLSYSAGSTQTGPLGFRKVSARSSLLETAERLWPELRAPLAGRTPLFINAYPAATRHFSHGIIVDTYLSPRILSRALQLGRSGRHPSIVAAQSLFLAGALERHVAAGLPLPETLILMLGGYATPRSLERRLEDLLVPRVRRLFVLQGFGAAEVDAGCMVGRERNALGEVIYHPRTDVLPEIDGGELLLTLLGADGTPIAERFPTGDRARRDRDGWVIWNPRRLHPDVRRELESWSGADWRRRTGYVRRDGAEIRIQLREGESPRRESELEFFDFARRFGFSWLDKPAWN